MRHKLNFRSGASIPVERWKKCTSIQISFNFNKKYLKINSNSFNFIVTLSKEKPTSRFSIAKCNVSLNYQFSPKLTVNCTDKTNVNAINNSNFSQWIIHKLSFFICFGFFFALVMCIEEIVKWFFSRQNGIENICEKESVQKFQWWNKCKSKWTNE